MDQKVDHTTSHYKKKIHNKLVTCLRMLWVGLNFFRQHKKKKMQVLVTCLTPQRKKKAKTDDAHINKLRIIYSNIC